VAWFEAELRVYDVTACLCVHMFTLDG
jgi:hypothetical protein